MAKEKKCWSGYVRTPGTKKGTTGSCQKKTSNAKMKPKAK